MTGRDARDSKPVESVKTAEGSNPARPAKSSAGVRFLAAKAVARVSSEVLSKVLHRPAANFPGKIALYADPEVIAHCASRMKRGSVCVVGTNGKTTVSNLLANALEASGHRVCCNRTGANLDSGVASALLAAKEVDWGVFECDELWLAKIAPGLQPSYVVLLNLFRDQLDRCGEIDHVQDRIAWALRRSPRSVLVYNGDDPLCQAVADMVPNKRIAFGIAEDLHLPQNSVADGQMCQKCETILEYGYRQYGQLGAFRCPSCGFSRVGLDVRVSNVNLKAEGSSFDLALPNGAVNRYAFHSGGHYMVYNVCAMALAASLLGCDSDVIQRTVLSFKPDNGRLQEFQIGQHVVLLNLAKNPAGFNQSIKLVTAGEGPRAVAFFINDKEADGHDVSWLWDVDFEELAAVPGLQVFAGGLRAYDMQVRLKYAGIDAAVVDGVEQMMAALDAGAPASHAFVIANYTALPQVKANCEHLAKTQRVSCAPVSFPHAASSSFSSEEKAEGRNEACLRGGELSIGNGCDEGLQNKEPSSADYSGAALPALGAESQEPPVTIVHMLPDLLNLYGDGGNVKVLEQRLRWRGIPVQVQRVQHDKRVDFSQVDLVVMGGSPDREQRLASADLVAMRDDLAAYAEGGGPLLAICGSYQILGKTWLVDGEEVPGLGIVDMRTGRAGGSCDRLIDNVVLRSPLASMPVVGYENHAGRTYLDQGVSCFGRVISSAGKGNNDSDGVDGVLCGNVLGTYLHGPLLAKNPEIADWLLERALEHREKRTGCAAAALSPLDDDAEKNANAEMCRRLGC